MSLVTCIDALVRAKELDKDTGDEIISIARKLRNDLDPVHAPDVADVKAQERLVGIIEDSITREKELAVRRINTMNKIDAQMKLHKKGIATGALSHLVRDLDADAVAPWENVEGATRGLLGLFHSKFASGIDALRPGKAGVGRKKTLQRNVLKELFGEDSGDGLASDVAKSWKETTDFSRKMYNSLGGAMAERADWGLPQSHDMVQVGKVSKDEWINFILPRLNRDKMIDFDTGRPLTDERLSQLLQKTYDRIRTNGLIDLNPRASGGRSILANRHQDHRFLTFKDSTSWLEYQKKFGQGSDIYGTMTQHLEVMAKDTAMLKVLGPDPDGMVQFMVNSVRKDAATTGKSRQGVKIRNLENVYEVLTDRINTGADEAGARFMAGGRNLLIAAQLGGAFLSSVSDFGFARIAAQYNGLPASKVMRNYLKLMNPINKADRSLAVQMGLVAESATSVALAQKRFFGEVMGPRVTQIFSDVVLRASLLTPHTQMMRHAFGMETLGFMARNSDKTFNELEKPFQDFFGRYGITPTDWDAIRTAPKLKNKGAEFINVREVAKIGDGEAAFKLQQGIQTEMDFAVPVPGARERALVTGGTRPGTIIGEIARSTAMYKSFPITVITGHMMRGLTMASRSKTQAAVYLANLFITTTVLGAMAVQMKQMSRGKDPITMNPNSEEGRKFWSAASLQGGGVGLFGDFLFADQNRFGSSPAMTFAGPVARLVDDGTRLTVGNFQQAIKGEKTNAARELVDFAGRYVPGSSMWYTRAAFDRMLLDQMRLMTDQKANSKFKRMETNARKDFGQKYWWRPGKVLPDRPPDLQEALEP